jgi:DNA polymerase
MRGLVVEFPEFEKLQRLYLLEEVADEWDGCGKCKNLVNSRTRIVHGSGKLDADMMIIGEAPGNEEDAQGVPFIGDSGMLLNQLLILGDMDRQDVFVENLVPCRPLDNAERPSIRPPSRREVDTCLPRVHETILKIDPLLIVAMGRSVLHALTRDTSLTITRARGGVHIIRVPGVLKTVEYPMVVSQHPAFILRNPSEAKHSPKWYLVRDFVFAVKLLNLAKKCYRKENSSG